MLLGVTESNNVLTAGWRVNVGAVSFTNSYQLQISGCTLIIKNKTDVGAAGGLYFNCSEATESPEVIYIPYLTIMNIMLTKNVFVSMFVDWESTHSSEIEPVDETKSATSVGYAQKIKYNKLTSGIRRPVDETVYLSVSPSLSEVLPNVPGPKSPLRTQSVERVIFDVWSHSFSNTQQQIEQLTSAGYTNFWVIVHMWQNGGYDNMLPDSIPAGEMYGGSNGLSALSQTIRDAGYIFSLHENYVDCYTNSSSWNTNYVARNSDGTLKKAWFNPLVNEQSYQVKPSHASTFLSIFAPQIHTQYNTQASYLDVHSAALPSYKIDYDANVTNAGKFLETLKLYRELPGLLRSYHNGPVSGEGNAHFLHAGYYDDFEAQINTGKRSLPNSGQWLPLLVDFNLQQIHDKTFSHGVGYQNRFLCKENGVTEWPVGGMTRDMVLKCISTELAYGLWRFRYSSRGIFKFF